MNREKVISREYKLILKAEKFKGERPVLLKTAHLFWSQLKDALSEIRTQTSGDLETITQRDLRFYDTKNSDLYIKSYIFRKRISVPQNEAEITLKFRHADRYISQDRYMLPKKIGQSKTKFEEDIKAPFQKLYSFSSSCPLKKDKSFQHLKQIERLYPGLDAELGVNDDKKLHLVNDLKIHELVITGAELDPGGKHSSNLECALIVWYNSELSITNPVIVEFSFRYKDKKERYPANLAQDAHNIYMLIQEKMKSWLGAHDTKTALVYRN